MQQLSATDSGLLFYCDLENILDGLSDDFARPVGEDGYELSSDDSNDAETSRCYISLEEAKSSARMANAALSAKNKVVEELSLEAVILREELCKERTLRRAAEAADEDQSFLREQMETILKEKARLAQDNARLRREAQTMAKQLEILTVQIENAAEVRKNLPKRMKEVEKRYKKEKAAKLEAEENAEKLRKDMSVQKQEIERLQHKMDEERENWKCQERALLHYASKQKMFQTTENNDDLSFNNSNKKGLAMVSHSRIVGGGGKSKRIIAAELEDMSNHQSIK